MQSRVNEYPDDAEHGDKQVVPVTAGLPVAARREGDVLHDDLEHKHQREHRTDHR